MLPKDVFLKFIPNFIRRYSWGNKKKTNRKIEEISQKFYGKIPEGILKKSSTTFGGISYEK